MTKVASVERAVPVQAALAVLAEELEDIAALELETSDDDAYACLRVRSVEQHLQWIIEHWNLIDSLVIVSGDHEDDSVAIVTAGATEARTLFK